MVSVTNRIKEIKQPRGGYIKPKAFTVTDLSDMQELYPNENVHATLIGIAVDYLTRFLIGTPIQKVFEFSLQGAYNIQKLDLANELLDSIRGVDDDSIISTCKLVGFDTVYRGGINSYKPVEEINPDKETISNIRIMVNRGIHFFEQYGPVVKDGFTFEGGYTDKVRTGDGDFLTEHTLWDFKVSKNMPTNKHTLQLMMYYLMGIHSIHPEFDQIENLGIFNPRLNQVYTLAIDSIDSEIIEQVKQDVIGY